MVWVKSQSSLSRFLRMSFSPVWYMPCKHGDANLLPTTTEPMYDLNSSTRSQHTIPYSNRDFVFFWPIISFFDGIPDLLEWWFHSIVPLFSFYSFCRWLSGYLRRRALACRCLLLIVHLIARRVRKLWKRPQNLPILTLLSRRYQSSTTETQRRFVNVSIPLTCRKSARVPNLDRTVSWLNV